MRAALAPVLVLLIVISSLSEAAGQARKTSRPFATITADWTRILDRVQLQLNDPLLSAEAARGFRAEINAVRDEARQIKVEAEAEIATIERLAAALGEPPADEGLTEPEEIADARSQYAEDIAFFQARIAQSDLAIVRSDELDRAISILDRERYLENLLTRNPLPFAPETVTAALPELLQVFKRLANTPRQWWQTRGRSLDEGAWLAPFVLMSLAIAAGWSIRLLLLRRLGRDPTIAEPSYTRRFVAAIAEAIARGIVPALILALIWYRVSVPGGLVTGPMATMVAAFCESAILFILAWAVLRAVLAPDLPAWGLTSVTPRNALTICRHGALLAGVFAVDDFILTSTAGMYTSPALDSFYLVFANTIEGLLVLSLIRGRLWQAEEPAEPESEVPAEPAAETKDKPPANRVWSTLQLVIGGVALAGIATTALGYSALGFMLIKQLLISGIVVGVLTVLRGLFRELIGVGLRSRMMRDRLSVRHATRSLMKFWLRAVLDVAMFAIGVLVLVPLWAGVAIPEVWAWTSNFLRGFTIGNVTISITDIATAIVVFVLALAVTRAIQRGLSERILPQTRLDTGVQHSLSAGFGYLGLVIAGALGISALGIDLGNVALIAGALSVGIGFGLQNVVNNFVSGLILLIERPIKVGDWVSVAGDEGFVKRINVRATELETFHRASIIIPNADLLSSAVTNLTHKDRYGRIDVGVGVAYGSDTEKVRDILLECARAHSRVLQWPEPFVVFQNFGDSSLDFELRCYTADVIWKVIIASDLRFEIDRRFREAGVEIPFPQRVVHHANRPPRTEPGAA